MNFDPDPSSTLSHEARHIMFRKYRRLIAWLLVVAMTLSPSLVYCQPPAGAATTPAAKPAVDTGYVTPQTAAVLVAYPRHVLTDPAMELLPLEVLTAWGQRDFGIDPLQIEQLLVVAEPPQNGPPGAVAVLRLAEAVAEDKVHAPAWCPTVDDQLDGKAYHRGRQPMDLSVFRADDHTVLLGTDPLLRKVVANHAQPKPGAMSKLLGNVAEPPDLMAFVLMEPLRPLVAMPLAMVKLPPQFSDLPDVPNLIASISAKLNITGSPDATLSVRATDEAAAEQLEKIIDKLMDTARQQAAAATAKGLQSDDPVEQANAKYGQRLSEGMLPAMRPVRKGDTLTLATDLGKKGNPQLASVATIGLLVGLLLPAVQAAREAARRTVSSNNMKQIMLAMHNYNAVMGRFPARANFDKQGKPLLSWRVLILPYLEEQTLYNQFRLDEPWDSPNNKKLIPLMPALYQNPSQPPKRGMASYLAVCGKGLAFDGDQGRRIADFTKGTSTTIMLVEADADRAVIWTKPDDWECDAARPLAGLGNAHPSGFSAGFADGSVRLISGTMDPRVFYALLTLAGGEGVNPAGPGP
jgi:hypothetical protein